MNETRPTTENTIEKTAEITPSEYPLQTPRFKRILLKLSGEALLGEKTFGIDAKVLNRLASEIKILIEAGIEISLVVGGGNLFRGAELQESGMERVTGDHMGMLATVMNALALQDAIEKVGIPVRVMSALPIDQVCEEFIRRRAVRHMEKKRVVICAAGTGNPFFTTDTAASLRAIELETDAMLKATKVDGVYDADPHCDKAATKYKTLSYNQVLEDGLAVMDATAVVMCRDNNLPLLVFNMTTPGEIVRALFDPQVGTLIR
ncbi:UMP kinase [Ostreibacterium oceani]|uniref:Uridylate kinase n=1 Tax=Ostreibacterium oceani TaxID=2654998 RepID=A0A6N7EVC9_9GAMM|nr:UMP kinase [Ostreibacterium oceani]MPV85555.1 UMP kinase [Ostreibacterium oceani]